jgi:hypothetical protein
VGSIMTFNWKDKSSRITRQLAGQDYYICFRTELVNNHVSIVQIKLIPIYICNTN